MSVDSLKELYIHHVEKAKESGCPKPLAIDLVITATTAARPLPDETDPAFVQYFKEELDKRKELDKYYEGFIEYLENLGLKEHSTIVADSLIKMKGHIHSTSANITKTKRTIFRAWGAKVAELFNDADYIRPNCQEYVIFKDKR
uniref:Uncharacterized protein n=1 Tax=Panagrolaimus superbus TaxID=310955 RepID=A0A914Z554_9BILA